MFFNSLQFAIFLPVVVILYFWISARYRWLFLLGASYYFYMQWRPEFVLLVIASTIVDYFAAIWIAEKESRAVRVAALLASLSTNLGLLCAFKYLIFLNQSWIALSPQWNVFAAFPNAERFLMEVGVPVGLSFYTFQTLSYTIDVFRGVRGPEYHFGYFALYVAYFPQFVAGPIERSTTLLPQLRTPTQFDEARTSAGLKLILCGLIKKVVVADNLALVVDKAYADPSQANGFTLLVATYLFAFQIYCDFSGYSDIAIGSARILGITLMQNFRTPYFSKSIPEFWSRWHISLSTWFRDYLYISLGGNRRGTYRMLLNVSVVFLASGLWHGANWTFVVWGGIHGGYYLVSRGLSWCAARRGHRLVKSSPIFQIARVAITFHLVVLSWVFFRANSLSDAWHILHQILFNFDGTLEYVSHRQVRKCIWLVLALVIAEAIQQRFSIADSLGRKPIVVRWAAYYCGVVMFFMLGAFESNEFIYFQF